MVGGAIINLYGELEIKTEAQIWGCTHTYQWTGGPMVRISEMMLADMGIKADKNGRIHIGPYWLRKLPEPEYGDYIEAIRDEPWWWPVWAWLTCRNWYMRNVNWRIILTLCVWGIARRPRNWEPIGWYLLMDKEEP